MPGRSGSGHMDYMDTRGDSRPGPNKDGNFLKKLRRDLGITQAQLAEEINRSQSWVTEIESHKSNITFVSMEIFIKGLAECTDRPLPLVTIQIAFEDETYDYEFD